MDEPRRSTGGSAGPLVPTELHDATGLGFTLREARASDLPRIVGLLVDAVLGRHQDVFSTPRRH